MGCTMKSGVKEKWEGTGEQHEYIYPALRNALANQFEHPAPAI
jgi:hypothetical protein